MITLKIGGVIFDKENDFSKIIDILSGYDKKSEEQQFFIVISAFGKTSRILSECITQMLDNNENSSKSLLNDLKTFYYDKLSINNINSKGNISEIDKLFGQVENLLKGVYLTSECSRKSWDKIMSYGEIISSKIIYFYLLSEYSDDIIWVSASDLIATDNNFNNASPSLSHSLAKYNDVFPQAFDSAKSKVIISQGFFGANLNGETTTMGFESSNLSACLMAYLSSSTKLVFISDVRGIRTSDPKLFKYHQIIEQLNYDDALELGELGIKHLFPSMINFLKKHEMKIEFRSYSNYSGEFTRIARTRVKLEKAVIIAQSQLGLINIYNAPMSLLAKLCSDTALSDIIKSISYAEQVIKVSFIDNCNYGFACNRLEDIII